jgi:hypothetical protein
MNNTKWPYCSLKECHLHYKCQSEQNIIMRILRDDEETKDIFESCQKITRQSIKNGWIQPHSK